MIPRLYYYYVDNNILEYKIISSVNDIKNTFHLPAFIHLSFDAPLPSSIEEEFIKLPKILFSSVSFANANLPNSWQIDFSQEIILKDIILFPVETAFGENLKNKEEEWVLLDNFSQDSNDKKQNIFFDYKLDEYNWSVRTDNVFKSDSIIFLSDLVKLNSETLLNYPNFGRNSLLEVESFLSSQNLNLNMDLTNYTIKSEYDDRDNMVQKPPIMQVQKETRENKTIISDFLESLLLINNERKIDIIKKRAGVTDKKISMTLEEIGSEYSVTRERIRQIEAKGLDIMRKAPICWDIDNYWSLEIKQLLKGRLYPLSIDYVKTISKFSDIELNLNTLKFILTHLDTNFYY